MRRFLLLSVPALVVSALLTAAFAFASVGSKQRPRDIPPELRPPKGQKLVLKAHGKGSQVYDCDAATRRWIFREPAAALSRHGRTIGIHYAGPTWELFDGSKVTGAQTASRPAPKPAKDIPWLLLKATSHAGSGTLSAVDYVQRVFTKGGVAPSGGTCDPAADKTVGVRYTAVYIFYSDGA